MKHLFLSVIICVTALFAFAAGPIIGPTSVCVGSNIPLFDLTPGGTWSSSNTSLATVDIISGNVGGVAAGVVTITYIDGTGPAFLTITVNPLPAPIGGSTTVAVGSTITLTDATTPGTWSSNNTTLATANASTGDVGGVAVGTPVISYTLPTGCYQTITITVTSAPSCGPVTGLAASSVTSTSATISWTAVAGSSGYEYVINTTAAAPTGSGTSTSLTSTSPSTLSPSTTYYAHVRNNCGSSVFSTWTTISFTTLAPSCGAITGLTASGITSTSATISWTAVTGSLGYQYVINTSSAAPAGSGTGTTLLSTTPTGLSPATTYYAHVRDSCGVGNFSAWVTIPFTTLSGMTCTDITGLTVTGITSTSATVTWIAIAGTAGYQYVINTTSSAPIGSGTATPLNSATPTGLTPATLYYAHVRDSCGAGNLSAWVTVPFTTTATPPSCAPVTGLSASGMTKHGATISWTPISGTAGYKYVIDNVPSDPSVSGTATHLYINAVGGLSAGTSYYAHVRDSCGPGNLSAWRTVPFSTLPATDITNINTGLFNVTAYPNPVTSILSVRISGRTGQVALQLTDISGKLIHTQVASEDLIQIEMEQLPKGIYLLRYEDEANSDVLKICR